MSTRTAAQVAAIDQAHAEAVADLARFIEAAREGFSRCGCGRGLDDAQHAADLASVLLRQVDEGEVASMLAVAILRDAAAEGGARDGE